MIDPRSLDEGQSATRHSRARELRVARIFRLENWPGHQGSAPTLELVKKMGMIAEYQYQYQHQYQNQYQYQSIGYNSTLHIQ